MPKLLYYNMLRKLNKMIIDNIKSYFKKQFKTFGFYMLLVFSISFILFYINFHYPNDYIKWLMDKLFMFLIILSIPYFWYTVNNIIEDYKQGKY